MAAAAAVLLRWSSSKASPLVTASFWRVLGCPPEPPGRELRELLCSFDDAADVQAALDELRRGEAELDG